MRRFDYTRAADIGTAMRAGSGEGARYLAGGTNLVDLIRRTSSGPLGWWTSTACRSGPLVT